MVGYSSVTCSRIVRVCGAADNLAFDVTLDRPTAEANLPEQNGRRTVSGRLYVFLSQRDAGEPMRGPSWFQPEPFFAVDVRDVQPGESRRIDASAEGYPEASTNCPPASTGCRRSWITIFIIRTRVRGPEIFIALSPRSKLSRTRRTPSHSCSIM